jgi:dTDP-4-dehydrorhamnose reductase
MFSKKNDKGFLPIILDHILNDKELTLYREIGSVSYAPDVCRYITDNINDLPKEIEVANSGAVSRLDWAMEVSKLLNKELKFKFAEGHKKTRTTSVLDGTLRPWQEALRECLCDKGYLIQS